MEVIVRVERRRRWRPDEKLRILAELDGPGVTFADVARRHEISRGLLWQWRDAQRRGVLVEEEAAFMPVRIVPELPAPPVTAAASAAPAEVDAAPDDDRIEILLVDGTALRVPETISTAALRRLLAALRG